MALADETAVDDTEDATGRRRRRVVRGALLLLAAGFAFHWWWVGRAAGRLEGVLDELRRAGEPVSPEDLNGPSVPRDENAAPDLEAAIDLIDRHGREWRSFRNHGLRLPLSDEDLEQARAVRVAYRDALDLVRQADDRRQVAWGRTFESPMISEAWPELGEQRDLAVLLRAAALSAHLDGDDRSAVQYAADMLFIAEAVARQPTLMPHQSAVGIATIAADTAGQIATDLRVEPELESGTGDTSGDESASSAAGRAQVESLIAALLDDGPMRAALPAALRGDRVIRMDALAAIAGGRLAPSRRTAGGPPSELLWGRVKRYAARPALYRAAEDAARRTDVLLAAAAAPDWPTFRARAGVASGSAPATQPQQPEAAPTELAKALAFVDSSLPPPQRVAQAHYRALAHRRMVAVALAVRLYRAGHDGAFPATLEDLVPSCLPAVPLDPLAEGGRPLGYVPDPDRPRVYSVGENGTDDGGREPDYRLPRGQWRRTADDVRLLTRPAG